MFQNSYQNGSYFDFFDPKANADKLKPLYKTVNIPVNHKVFDKQLKTYVLQSLQSNGKMTFPRQDRKELYLIQQYLVLQVYFFQGMAWSVELTFSDLTKTKRRVILSPATTKTELKPFFVKTPCKSDEGVWNSFVVDLYSYMEAFKGQTYRSLDSIVLSGHFKLRRIYTTSTEPPECSGQEMFDEIKPLVNLLPKQFCLPMGLPTATLLNRYDINEFSQLISQGEHSTKNSSFLKSSKARSNITQQKNRNQLGKSRQGKRGAKVQQVKTEKSLKQIRKPRVVKQETKKFQTEKNLEAESKEKKKIQQKKKKDFLSNTNGELIARKKRQQDRPSIDKNSLSQKMQRGKSNPKGKANPWRSGKDDALSEAQNLAVSKHESHRKAVTPDNGKFSAFKKSKIDSDFNQTKNRQFEGYSDSQYVELSQKFSTFTDGKFLKTGENNLVTQNIPNIKQEQDDEIQQNIQMESNSMYSSRPEEEKKPAKKNDAEFIKESINDSLDIFGKGNSKEQKIEEMARSSLYGFGQNLMRSFMAKNIERPYSPPIGERQNTESQSQKKFVKGPVDKDEVQLIFDPVLNCYYDYRTHTYYQLKN